MQLRHLRYFVAIVEAGSFSRAAAVVHIVQPALSQQIAELEEKIGTPLLHRGPRGVRPTAAGEVLYREAQSILRQMQRLSSVVRSVGVEPEGTVSFGMSSSLASFLAGPFIEACKTTLPHVSLRFVTDDSAELHARLGTQKLDLAVVFEADESPGPIRLPLFRQRLYHVHSKPREGATSDSISLDEVAAAALVLPAAGNVLRVMVERAFAEAGLTSNVVAEANVMSSLMSAVQSGFAGSIVPKGDFSDVPGHADLLTLPIEPAVHLTANLLASSTVTLTHAGEAVRDRLREFMRSYVVEQKPPGAQWIGG